MLHQRHEESTNVKYGIQHRENESGSRDSFINIYLAFKGTIIGAVVIVINTCVIILLQLYVGDLPLLEERACLFLILQPRIYSFLGWRQTISGSLYYFFLRRNPGLLLDQKV